MFSYYHSFGSKSKSYGSGDSFNVILSSVEVDDKPFETVAYHLISYFFKIFFEITGINIFNISYYIMPFIFLLILVYIFLILFEHDFLWAILSCIMIVFNPWLSYYSTEPSKEMMALLFYISSIYYLLKYYKKENKVNLFVSSFLISFSPLFYHSGFILVLTYIIILIYLSFNNKYNKRTLLKLLLTLFLFLLIISMPLYVIRYQNKYYTEKFSKDINNKNLRNDDAITESIRASFIALFFDQDKLAFFQFVKGIKMFIIIPILFTIFPIILLINIFLNKTDYRSKNIFQTIILSFIIPFILISILWTSSSHSSRYPLYVIIYIIAMYSYLLYYFISHINNLRLKVILTIVVILLIFIKSEPFKYVEGLRHLYIPQIESKSLLVRNNIAIDENNQITFIEWPGIKLSLYELGIRNDFMHEFGWGYKDLDYVTSYSYIKDNKIKYYIFAETGKDYFDSANQVLNKLQNRFVVKLIDKTERDDIFVSLYEIR